MFWMMPALLAALSVAIGDALIKRFFSDMTDYEMGVIRYFYAFPYLFFFLFVVPWPELDRTFWTCVAVGLPLELGALLLYMRAIRISPLSLTVPFLAFTPMFVIFTGNILLGERLNAWGIAGIFLIVTGSYIMNISKAKGQWIAPFKSILKEQGSWLIILASLIFSFTSTIGKVGILHSSPQFFAACYFLLFIAFLLMIFPLMPRAKLKNIIKRPLPGVIIGMVMALMIFCHTYAISLVQAAYMLSVKRSSLLFGVILGALVFNEEGIGERFFGAIIMLAGVCVIGFLG